MNNQNNQNQNPDKKNKNPTEKQAPDRAGNTQKQNQGGEGMEHSGKNQEQGQRQGQRQDESGRSSPGSNQR